LKEISRVNRSLREFRNTEVKGLIEYPPVVVDTETTISKIIGILKERDAYDLFIHLAGTAVIGINIRDILSARDISTTKPSILGKRIPTLNDRDNVGYAARIMTLYRLRALPVIESHHGDIIGQISAKVIMKAMRDSNIIGSKRAEITSKETAATMGSADITSMINRISSSHIMTANLTTVTSRDKVSAAKGIMIRHRIDHLPVVEKYRQRGPTALKGMLTSSHILQTAMLPTERIGRKSIGIDNRPTRLELDVSGIMEKNNVAVSSVDDSLYSAINLMLDTNSTYTIVKSFEEIQGIITYRDVIAILGEHIEEEIPTFIAGLPDDPFDAEISKSKFTTLVKLLRRVSPEIEEARCHMKLRDIQGQRKRYEVDVSIITPYKRLTYTNMGWDLPKMFDQMSDSLKNQLAHRRSRRQRETVRHLRPD
jgi:CBS domain-containing protein/ribosome-associated translation inhibitor RaiA